MAKFHFISAFSIPNFVILSISIYLFLLKLNLFTVPQQPQMPYEGSGGNSSSNSRYLELPNYATLGAPNRYSLDSSAVTRINDGLTASINSGGAAGAVAVGAAAGPNAPAATDHRHHHRSASNFARQHSWDSPVQFRRRQYG